MTALHTLQPPPSEAVLSLAFELGWTEWQWGVRPERAGAPRRRTRRARALRALWGEGSRAQQRCGLPDDASVESGSAAGGDGCWLQRCLRAHGLPHVVGDAARSEGKRRGRRPKPARRAARTWLTLLLRPGPGEQQVWRVGQGPRVTAEDRRHRQRARAERQAARTPPRKRSQGLLASGGRAGWAGGEDCPPGLAGGRRGEGQAVPAALPQRRWRAFARRPCVDRRRRDLAHARARRRRPPAAAPAIKQGRPLWARQGLGPTRAWRFVQEFFAWRPLAQRRPRGALAGLPAPPSPSGDSARAHGISKAGNRR